LRINGIILLILQVRLLLLPLSPLLLKRKQLLGLLCLSECALAVQVLQLLLVIISLLVELFLELSVPGITLSLDGIDLFLEALLCLQSFLQALLKRALLSHLRLVEQFILFLEALLLPLELLVTGLQFNNLSLSSFLDLLKKLLLLVFQLHKL
jgi:hypothetical protein